MLLIDPIKKTEQISSYPFHKPKDNNFRATVSKIFLKHFKNNIELEKSYLHFKKGITESEDI